MPPPPSEVAAAAAPQACRNCGERWPGGPPDESPTRPPRFCPACGQETNLKPPTVMEFAQQFGGAYLATEGALWRTLKLLLLKPGALTREYLNGRRKHYVLPLRLYLTISLIVLLAFRIVTSVNIDAPGVVQVDKGDLSSVTVELGWGRAGLKDGVFFCQDLPAWLCQRIQRRIDVQPEAVAGVLRQFTERLVGNLGAAMFVLLPGFALGLKLVYRSRRLRYTEHLVFALHVHAFWFLMFGLAMVPLGGLQDLLLLAVPLYTLLAMRRVYGGRWWPRLLRAGLVSSLYGVLLLLAMLGVAVWSFLT